MATAPPAQPAFFCGGKNQFCQPPPPPSPSPPPSSTGGAATPPSPPSPPSAPPPPPTYRRWEFADGQDGEWSVLPAVTERYGSTLHCAAGAMVSFWWDGWEHDVVRLPSADALASCDLGEAVPIAPLARSGQVHLPCATPGEDIYLTCSVSGHCQAGQRLHVHVSPTVYAFAASGAKLLHSDSLARVYTLLGVGGGEYGLDLTRGYQTEELAESTLQLVWCVKHGPGEGTSGAPPTMEPARGRRTSSRGRKWGHALTPSLDVALGAWRTTAPRTTRRSTGTLQRRPSHASRM